MLHTNGLLLSLITAVDECYWAIPYGAHTQAIAASIWSVECYNGTPDHVSRRHAAEYAAAFSYNPVALMTMARRTSRLSASCLAGLSYITPASAMIATEAFIDPSSVYFAPSSYTGTSLGQHVLQSKKDPAQVSYHVLSAMSKHLPNREDFGQLALPAAQRMFTGGDRFEQSYQTAVNILTTLHEKGLASPESVEFLINIDNKLGIFADPRATARAALNLLPKYDAHDAYGTTLLRLARQSNNPELANGLIWEARQQFAKTQNGAFDLLVLDLAVASPILTQALLSISPQLYRGDAATVHVFAQLTGDASCMESWNLMSSSVRKYLWYHAAKHTLIEGGKQIDDDLLRRMAMAGVEEAEWGLSVRINETKQSKANFLSFSAHRGRSAAQLLFSRLQPERKLHTNKKPKATKLVSDDEDAILDAWEPVKPLTFNVGEIAEHQLSLLTDMPARWMGFENEKSEFVAPYAEAVIDRAWNAYFGLGRSQSLRDCLIMLNRLGQGIKVIQWGYLGVFQTISLINYLLLNMGKIQIIACGGMAVSSVLILSILLASKCLS